jgi:methionyl-tRNA synthetase
MLDRIGVGAIDDLFDEIPKALRIESLKGVPEALPEMDVARLAGARAAADGLPINFIGAGAYEHHIPAPVWALVTRANRYVEENAPWTLAKKKDFVRLGAVLYNLAESLRQIALYLYPVMPAKAQAIWDALGIDKRIESCRLEEEQAWGLITPQSAIRPGDQLFRRIEAGKNAEFSTEKKMEKTAEEAQKPAPQPAPAGPELIGIEDFMKADLRVGKIVSAERVEKSEKLVKLKVDIGTETRQVVAGIGKSYTPEELTGKSVVIVANLKPAKLMGVESQGMLLAASSGDLLAVATFDRETKPGSRVK